MKIKIISLIYYDNTNKERSQQLIRESSFVTEHIVRKMQAFSFFDCGRINFICCNDKIKSGTREACGICEMDITFDPSFFTFSVKEKNHYLFNLLYLSLFNLCKIKQWDFTFFENAFYELKTDNYTSSFYTRLSIKRKGKCIRLLGIQRIDTLTFYLEFTSDSKQKTLFYLFDSKQSCFDYDRFLGKLEWKGEKEIVLIGKDNKAIAVTAINIDDT